jgi:hypothetical protein
LIWLLSCVKLATVVVSAQLVPSTVPVTEAHELGPWVEGETCVEIGEQQSVADLVAQVQARAGADGLISVTLEQVEDRSYAPTGRYMVLRQCFRIRGRVVRFVEPRPRLAGTAPAPPVPCCITCSNSEPCGDRCISRGEECHEPPGCACPKAAASGPAAE